MKLKIKNLHNLKYLGIYVLAFLTCFFPAYLCETNQYNLIFCTLEIPLILLLVKYMTSISGKRNKFMLLIIIIYFSVFSYYNIRYLQCYWSMFYKVGCFLMLWGMTECDILNERHEQFIDTIMGAVIFIFTITVVVSIIGNLFNLDAIWCDLENFHLRGEGAFDDRRLTWVFMHKSSYGMLLVGVLALILKKKDLEHRKILIGLYAIAALLINSMVSLVSFMLVIIAYYVGTKKIDAKFLIRFAILGVIALLVGGIGYYYIAMYRDLSSLGGRMYIWAMYKDRLSKYPFGMGKEFYSVVFWMTTKKSGRYISNFHNTILNEMIHYSIPVGVLYSILLLFIPIRTIIKKEQKLKNIILAVAIMLPAMGDQAVNDLVLPLYLIILYLCFAEYSSDDQQEKIQRRQA